MDGLRHSSSIGQAKGYASSPLGALRQKMSPSGSRSLHTSRPLSAPVANRPLSPHLPLKKPQLSATFSISHRIFGVALGAAIISIPLATKFSLMFGVWVKCTLRWWEVALLWAVSSSRQCNCGCSCHNIVSTLQNFWVIRRITQMISVKRVHFECSTSLL